MSSAGLFWRWLMNCSKLSFMQLTNFSLEQKHSLMTPSTRSLKSATTNPHDVSVCAMFAVVGEGRPATARLRSGSPASALKRTDRCPDEFEYSEKLRRCYRFDDDRVHWFEARRRCAAHEAHLLSVESDREQLYVNNMAATSKLRGGGMTHPS